MSDAKFFISENENRPTSKYNINKKMVPKKEFKSKSHFNDGFLPNNTVQNHQVQNISNLSNISFSSCTTNSNTFNGQISNNNRIFVGGLCQATTEFDIENYFNSFAKVKSVKLMLDKNTKISRRFGFVAFEENESIERILKLQPHYIHNKQLEVKKAIPKNQNDTNYYNSNNNQVNEIDNKNKLFLGGLKTFIQERDIVEYFINYGEILECFIKRNNNISRGFGFLVFKHSNSISLVLSYLKENTIKIKGFPIECKLAVPRNDYATENYEKTAENSSTSKEKLESIRKNSIITNSTKNTKNSDCNFKPKNENNNENENLSLSLWKDSVSNGNLQRQSESKRNTIFNEALIFNTNSIAYEISENRGISNSPCHINSTYYHLVDSEFYLNENIMDETINFNENTFITKEILNTETEESAKILLEDGEVSHIINETVPDCVPKHKNFYFKITKHYPIGRKSSFDLKDYNILKRELEEEELEFNYYSNNEDDLDHLIKNL